MTSAQQGWLRARPPDVLRLVRLDLSGPLCCAATIQDPDLHLPDLRPYRTVIILLPQSIAKRRPCDSFCFTRTRRVAS